MSIARRTRGVLVAATLWAVAWSVVGLALGLVAWAFAGPFPDPAAMIVVAAIRWAALGGVGGAAFALALAAAERQATSPEALSTARVARWGALGGAVLPLLLLPLFWASHPGALGIGVFLVPLASALGAGSATGSLRLARRAPGLAAPEEARHLPAPGV